MLTRCPGCQTIFRIREDQLSMADGLAHCYRCEQVFNARENILAEPATEKPSQPTEAPEFAHQNSDIEHDTENRNPAETYQSAEVESTIEEIQKELEPSPLTTEQEAPIHTHSAPLSIDDLLAKPAKKRSPLTSLLWFLASITLLAAAVVQIAWFEREQVIAYPEGRMLLEQLCRYANCQVPQRRDLSLISITQRQITSHPGNMETLLVQLTIKNQASFNQPYPLLSLSLSTTDGALIARRSFSPAEYLPSGIDSNQLMPAGISQQIEMAIEDPGIGVTSFEFDFF